jgi:hypothetical protein
VMRSLKMQLRKRECADKGTARCIYNFSGSGVVQMCNCRRGTACAVCCMLELYILN